MNVYIAYDNYGSGESFTVFNVETNRERAIKHFRNVDLIDFLSVGPDDCHSMQLEKVIMTRAEYLAFCDLASGEQTVEDGDELYEKLNDIFNETDYGWCETILVSDGYSDFQELLNIYCHNNGFDVDCGTDMDKAYDTLIGNTELIGELFRKHLIRKYYISKTFLDVYITYDRYEHDEWYSVYHIDTNGDSAYQHFIETDLPDFLCYGPDDCHAFVLQRVPMSSKEYRHLCYLNSDKGDQRELEDILQTFYHEEREVETLLFTDGCSDYFDIVRYYCEQQGYDSEDEDINSRVQEELFGDDELFKKVVKEYVKDNY